MRSATYAIAGIAMPVAIFIGAAIAWMALFLHAPTSSSPYAADASTATTTVEVLNIAPQWYIPAQEQFESSSSSPTNAGSNMVWTGAGQDTEDIYLIICKTSSTPTAVPNDVPVCAGGLSNQWAVAPLASTTELATAVYTTTSSDPEANDWFAFLCDHSGTSQCSSEYRTGNGTGSSPFVINHRPSFSVVSNDGPIDPGGVVTWSATSSDTDTYGGNDLTRLWVCRDNDFANGACGAGGTFCSSTLHATNPSCSSTFPIPQQDKAYNAYAYVVDEHEFGAQGGAHGSTSTYVINNVAPYIETSTMALLDVDEVGPLTLDTPEDETAGFIARFRVIDDNSCIADGGGDEVVSVLVNVFRSGVGAANCQVGGDYDPNQCYPGLSSSWSVTYTPSSTCGVTETARYWDAVFPLWYVADPTDGTATNTLYSAQYWTFTAQATDDDGVDSTLQEDAVGNEMASFLAFDVPQAAINYGGLAPGSSTDPLSASTTMRALGNVGLDENLFGDPMCPNYPTCPASPTSTIPETRQVYASSGVPYASGTTLTATSTEFELNIPKSTATSSPQTRVTYWGVEIPISITLAGDYTGQNTIIAVTSEPGDW